MYKQKTDGFMNFCPQKIGKYTAFYEEVLDMKMSEDCLTLNIFSPVDVKENKLLPVLILIHGGSFETGNAADYGIRGIIQNFVAKNIVVVTLNYRIGAYGLF